MSTFGRRIRRSGSDLRQPPPAAPAGAGWYVFEHLAELVLEDATVLDRMTPDQRLVYAVNLVRQEVASGGFEGYFDWTNASSVDNALAGFELLAPRLGAILQEALDLAQLHDEPDFDSLDAEFTLAEAQLTVDSVVDAYVVEQWVDSQIDSDPTRPRYRRQSNEAPSHAVANVSKHHFGSSGAVP